MAARVRVSRVIDAPASEVWARVADIGGHAHWQVDVRSIQFTSARHHGVGTTYRCDTRLGPIRMAIPMTVTEWSEGKAVAVSYEGALSGGGRITVKRRRRNRTKVTWAARVRLPWWLGGPFGALGSAQLLRVVWHANLKRLALELA